MSDTVTFMAVVALVVFALWMRLGDDIEQIAIGLRDRVRSARAARGHRSALVAGVQPSQAWPRHHAPEDGLMVVGQMSEPANSEELR